MANNNNDDERPATESTPLILRRSTVHAQFPSHSLPPLTPVVNHIRRHGMQSVDEDPSSLFPSQSASLPQHTAFKLIVLSQLYILAKTPSTGVRTDVWEQWSGERAASLDAEDLQRRIVHVWDEFIEFNRSTQEIEECLWSPFTLEGDKFHTVRRMFLIGRTRKASNFPSFFSISVVGILKDPHAPHDLVAHRLITLSLSHTWTRGRAVAVTPVRSFRSVATPRCVEPTLFEAVSLTTRTESCMP
jgi:hypothetical protein